MSNTIKYGKLMHQAMRGLIEKVLSDVAENGLPGDHHFFITFDPGMPGVELAEWLKERYPDEMTIVIQHWFEDLVVTSEGFGVTLNFGDNPEHLYVPYDSIQTFVDPSVEFGLRFEGHNDEDEEEADAEEAPMNELVASPEEDRSDAQVVRLDSFRKT